jgi:4,5-DOPA dioxygenase extradiol
MATLGRRYAHIWRGLASGLPQPKAVLMVTAHWYVDGLAVTAMNTPRTIHDFYGFPEELYQIRYPAPGSPWLARRIADLLSPLTVIEDQDWGLDHGAWSVPRHLIPDADVPVVQLSVDRTRPPGFHFELGLRLRDLRDEGILVAGSGDVVHNLRAAIFADDAAPYDWAPRFNEFVKSAIAGGRRRDLIDYSNLGGDARRAIPTPDHYLPLLYVLGAAFDDEEPAFFSDEVALASISMLGVAMGHPQPGAAGPMV